MKLWLAGAAACFHSQGSMLLSSPGANWTPSSRFMKSDPVL